MTVASEAAPRIDEGTLLDPESLARYADAVVRGSLAHKKGDLLAIRCHPEHREFAVALAEAGYRAGARFVDIRYDEPRAAAARLRLGPESALGVVTDWDRSRMRALIAPDAAAITITGDADPGIYDDIPLERMTRDAQVVSKKLGFFANAMKFGRVRWVGVAWPTPAWAARVYPDLAPLDGQRRLARDLLEFCRVGPDDPPGYAGWRKHVETIARRAKTLTRLRLERLELRGSGTELEFRLTADTLWAGGQEKDAYGQTVTANMPTEECFTSPDAAGTSGTFRCSRPLSFRGRFIDGIAGEFRKGRLVRLETDDDGDRDFLSAFLDAIPNAKRLGEVALVDSSSRIGQTRRVYSNTLIDENAVAHIAFGSGFPSITRPIDPGARGTRGVNRSPFHLDVMIGTDDLEATGIARGGKRVPLIRDGTWQI